MTSKLRQPITMALILTVTQAKLDWNLESTFLQHL